MRIWISIILLVFTLTAVAGRQIIYCPTPDQIQINDIYSGLAKSTDGQWTGTSAIPPAHEKDWRDYAELPMSCDNLMNKFRCVYGVLNIYSAIVLYFNHPTDKYRCRPY